MIELSVTAEFVASCRPAQLHDEARGQKRDWPASFVEQPDGTWVYRVDRDDVDPSEVQAAIDAHEPVWPPDPVEQFRQAVEGASSVADLKSALLGESGPGAEPRRPSR